MANETTPLIDGDASRKKTAKPPPIYVYLVSFIATVNSINLGFEVGVSSGVGLLIQEDMHLTDLQLGMYMSSVHFMAAIGCMFSHYFCDRLGRCLTFTASQAIFLMGIFLLVTSQGFEQALCSRIFTGFAVGVALAIDPLYISEVAPASHRGQLTTLSEIAINVGLLLGFIANWAFADDGWRVMPLVGAIGPTSLIILSLTVMPESPRWLAAQERDHEAEEILRNTHPVGEDVSILMEGIKRDIQEEAKIKELGWQPLLKPDAQTRWMMIVGIGVAAAQQLTGAESLVMYSPEIFKQAGVANTEKGLFAVTVCLGIAKASFVCLSACFLDDFGRRPLLLLSMAGVAASQVTVSVGLAINNGVVAVIGVFSFIGFFSIGIGPIPWLLASEVFPFNIRAKAMSVAACSNRIASATVALTFLPLSDLITLSGYFGFFAGVSALITIVQFFTVPETKGRTLESVKEMFDSSNFRPSRTLFDL